MAIAATLRVVDDAMLFGLVLVPLLLSGLLPLPIVVLFFFLLILPITSATTSYSVAFATRPHLGPDYEAENNIPAPPIYHD